MALARGAFGPPIQATCLRKLVQELAIAPVQGCQSWQFVTQYFGLAFCGSFRKMSGMLERMERQQLTQRLNSYPAVALLGPRQCGKTTLARSFGRRVYDLEKESEVDRLRLQWDSVMASNELVVFDEAQNWPELFSRLRSAIDNDRHRNGRFLLLGSVSPFLIKQISQSLAGRISFVELTPFLLPEVGQVATTDNLWLHGGYPDGGVLDGGKYPQWQQDYLTTLAERDLPAWGLPSKAATTKRFFRMLAATQGQTWNASMIANSMGVNHETISSYLEYLVGSFLIRRLQPYYANIRKRIAKTPKTYWRDPGLLHCLLNVADQDQLLSQPWVGASWEGFVIEQAIGVLNASGRHFEPYYFRAAERQEIDLVLDFGAEIWAVEVKLAAFPSIEDMERLHRAADLIKAKRRILVCKTSETLSVGNATSCGLEDFLKMLLA